METGIVGPDELGELDPCARTTGVSLAAYEPRSGYADPTAAAVGFLRAAKTLGARFERRRATALLVGGDRLGGVGRRMAPWSRVPWCSPPGRGPCRSPRAGLDLPIRPARVRVALFERPYALPTHLTLIDTTEGFYARPAAGRPRPRRQPGQPRVAAVAPTLRRRSPTGPASWKPCGRSRSASPRSRKRRSGRSGILDMTPDGRPLLRPAGPRSLPCRRLERDGGSEGAGGRGRGGALGLRRRPEQAGA